VSGELERALAELDRGRSPGGRRELQAYTIEGTRLLERALRAGARLRTAVVGRGLAADEGGRTRSLLDALEEAPSCTLLHASDSQLLSLTEGRTYGDVLALVELPPVRALSDCLLPDRHGRPATLLAAHDAEDPGNVGALLRTALASGAGAFVALGKTDPYHPKAVRTSMGSLFKLPVLERADGTAFLEELAQLGGESWAAVAQGGEPLPACERGPQPAALLLGSEAHGLPPTWLERVDRRVTIPTSGEVDSLSINAAAAVGLYELVGRRGGLDTK